MMTDDALSLVWHCFMVPNHCNNAVKHLGEVHGYLRVYGVRIKWIKVCVNISNMCL